MCKYNCTPHSHQFSQSANVKWNSMDGFKAGKCTLILNTLVRLTYLGCCHDLYQWEWGKFVQHGGSACPPIWQNTATKLNLSNSRRWPGMCFSTLNNSFFYVRDGGLCSAERLQVTDPLHWAPSIIAVTWRVQSLGKWLFNNHGDADDNVRRKVQSSKMITRGSQQKQRCDWSNKRTY